MSVDEKTSASAGDRQLEFPKLQPIPIETKNKNIAIRIFRWVTSIRKWRLIEDWQYQLPDGTNVIIPKNFVFDGASIPRPLWMVLSPTGLLFIPGLIHDFAYRYDYLWAVDSNGELSKYKPGVGQEFWDKTFNEVAGEVNGLKILDGIAWAMLALFGRFSWKSNRKLNAPEITPNHLPVRSKIDDSSADIVATIPEPEQAVSSDVIEKPVDKVVEVISPEQTEKKMVSSSDNVSPQDLNETPEPTKTRKPRKPRKTKKSVEIA